LPRCSRPSNIRNLSGGLAGTRAINAEQPAPMSQRRRMFTREAPML